MSWHFRYRRCIEFFLWNIETQNIVQFHSYFYVQLVSYEPQNILNYLYFDYTRSSFCSVISLTIKNILFNAYALPTSNRTLEISRIGQRQRAYIIIRSIFLREIFLGSCETIRKCAQFVSKNYTIISCPSHWIVIPIYSVSRKYPNVASCRIMSTLNVYYSLFNQDMPQITLGKI